MSKSIQAQAASIIRKHIKSHGIAARVTSSSASMMTAVDVDITDEMPATVRAVREYVGQFAYGHFDGMTDSYDYSNGREDIPQVKYAHVDVRFSDEMREAAREFCAAYWSDWNEINEWKQSDRVNECLHNDDPHTAGGRFWSDRKPRVRAA